MLHEAYRFKHTGCNEEIMCFCFYLNAQGIRNINKAINSEIEMRIFFKNATKNNQLALLSLHPTGLEACTLTATDMCDGTRLSLSLLTTRNAFL
uniref:Uncharacterized protein n=2 Tax=Anguilla anguilla TaxID=7936 RepID=A0A0E9XT92_ANGAN